MYRIFNLLYINYEAKNICAVVSYNNKKSHYFIPNALLEESHTKIKISQSEISIIMNDTV